MRRLLSLVLLVVFGLLAVAPAFGLSHGGDASLPACCRRNGVHHCGMATERTAPTHFVSIRCESFPQARLASSVTRLALPSNEASVTEPHVSLTITLRCADAERAVVRDRSQYKRGPPTELL